MLTSKRILDKEEKRTRAVMAGARSAPQFKAIKYFGISLLAMAVILLIVDRFAIPQLEDAGKIEALGWREDNRKIQDSMRSRNFASHQNPIWRSELFPVSEKKQKAKRILVLGDSFVWGDGYANMNTIWWRQLERELQRRGYLDCEVIAAGLCDIQTHNEIAWARTLVPRYKPDLVIVGYVPNDACEFKSNGERFVKVYARSDGKFWLSLRQGLSSGLPNLVDQLFHLRRQNRLKLECGEKNGYATVEWERRLLSGENFDHYRKTVQRMGEYVRNSSIPVFVTTLPYGFHDLLAPGAKNKEAADYFDLVELYLSERYQPVEKLFKQAGVLFVNTLKPFIALSRNDKELAKSNSPLRMAINPSNAHPGPFSTHFHAVTTADFLERNYGHCLGPRTKKAVFESPHVNDAVPHTINLRQWNGGFSFDYPEDPRLLLSMPLRKPYVQLNFKLPVKLSSLKISGSNLADLSVYVTAVDHQSGYDNQKPVALGFQKGATCNFSVPATYAVNTLWIAAHFNQGSRNLTVKLNP